MTILGIGIDVIEIDRVEQAVGRWGEHFLNHVFCEEEIDYAQKHKFPFQHYAARFAAKEAILKAIGNMDNIRWKDLKILNDKNGKPYCIFNKKDFRHKIFLSISHSHKYAVANAIITE
jgi:holo-[acyl-carrier protein] synthase